jgi:hypothetical protein
LRTSVATLLTVTFGGDHDGGPESSDAVLKARGF